MIYYFGIAVLGATIITGIFFIMLVWIDIIKVRKSQLKLLMEKM